ncbi:WD repeat-containing protein on Y chromosome-like [Echeneis naucrates]|uniref:WD repeat-containing protein on Y chromosome-like n=1 Tax=Echeneis naucrates TaxID=173247 RepID=UPI0011144EAC|nr:WD repeat-containing protein on Y chromosome-like [Echeneis naucrates]
MWTTPQEAEYGRFPWKFSPSEVELCKAFTAPYGSTYTYTTRMMKNTSGPRCQGVIVADDLSASMRASEDTKAQPEWLMRERLKQSRRRHSFTHGDKVPITRQQQHSIDSTHKLCSLEGQFCTYMLQEHKEKEESTRRSKQVAFILPATIKSLGHGLPIVNIHSTHDGAIITVREDGAVCIWSHELKPDKTKHIFSGGPANSKSKWITDFTLMPEYNKLMVGTGDREIQLYELSTLEPYCQISALDTMPLTLDYGYIGQDKCCILYGDTEGCVTIILISCAGDTLRLWNKLPKVENIPNIAIDNAVVAPNVTFIRWKVHRDWVTEAKYFPGSQAVVSASNDELSSLVIDAEQQLSEIREACYEGKTKKAQLSWTPQVRASCDQTIFSIYKGVKTFDLSQKHSLLVTGGMDRVIRLWNPHFSGKPTGILKGHSAPIVFLCVSSADSQIFSVSIDNTVKIWDIQDQCCLFTADPKASQIHGDISACFYSSAMKSLFTAADCLAVLSLKLRPQFCRHLTESHDEPVTCCGYSEEFRRVVSCTEGSVVKVWDFDTGRQVFEFGGVPDRSAITCMTFDLSGRRLITGGRDGCLKIWNFNSGQCLKTLKKDGGCHEVCDCIFLKAHRNCYVMSVGRDRKIDIYPDIPEDFHRVQRPQPSWQDDLNNGHSEDILCMAQSPPTLLATGSYDGEIILWNMVSGSIQCRFVSPRSAEHQNAEGLDTSVQSIIFLKNLKLQQLWLASALLSSGTMGCINIWNVSSGGKCVGSFKASRFKQKITKMAQTNKGTLLYAADQIGYIYVYQRTKIPKRLVSFLSCLSENFWRAHTSRVSGLQIVDNDQVVLTSSPDYTVRLWSTRGEFIGLTHKVVLAKNNMLDPGVSPHLPPTPCTIVWMHTATFKYSSGTFGQSECWSIHISSTWMHPAVPYELLIHPASLPEYESLNVETHLSDVVSADKTAADCGELKSETDSKLRLATTSISDTDI